MRAVRSRCAPSVDGPALAINIRSPVVTKELPALLPALTELRRVSISADTDDPNADQDDSTHAPATQAAHGWASLITTALRSHPQLASVHIHLPPPPAQASDAPAKYTKEGHAAVLGALTALTAVTELRLRCREVQAQALGDTLRTALPQLSGLQRLELSGGGRAAACSITGRQVAYVREDGTPVWQDAGADVATGVAALRGLTHLRLAVWYTSGAEGHALAAAIPQLTALVSLELDNYRAQNNSSGEENVDACGALIRSVARCAQLTRLNLHLSTICAPDEAMHALAGGLSALRRLDVSVDEPATGSKDVFHGAAFVQACLTQPNRISNIEYLDLSGHYMSQGQTIVCAQHLRGLSRLQCLRLRNIPNDDGAVALLARAAPGLTALQQLDLQQTRPSDDAVVQLAAALPRMPALQTLSLKDHRFSEANARVLAHAFGTMPQLAALDFSMMTTYNGVKPTVFSALIEGIAQASGLRDLRVSTNGLNVTQLRKLMHVCGGKLKSLAYLDLSGNLLGADAWRQGAQLVASFPALCSVNLQGVGAQGEDFRSAARALAEAWDAGITLDDDTGAFNKAHAQVSAAEQDAMPEWRKLRECAMQVL